MCADCEEKAEAMRPIVDAMVNGERHQRVLNPTDTNGQHCIRLANTILSVHADDNGGIGDLGLRSMALEYAIVVQRLLALQEISGMSPPT